MGRRLAVFFVLAVVVAGLVWLYRHFSAAGRQTLRAIGASTAGGVVGGALAGLGSRVDMRIIALMSRSHYGETNHSDVPIGMITLDGTMTLVLQGALVGIAGGWLYALVRRWLPPGRWARAGSFTGLLVLVTWPVVLTGAYEFVRYVSARVSVPLFALLFPIYGFAASLVAEALAGGRDKILEGRRVRLYRAALVLACLLGVYQVWKSLHLVYHLV